MPMVILAAAALAAELPPSRTMATAQATATVRVLRAAVLKLDGSPNAGAPPARDSVIAAADGTRQRVKVIDFE